MLGIYLGVGSVVHEVCVGSGFVLPNNFPKWLYPSEWSFKIFVKSYYLLKACQWFINSLNNSWNSYKGISLVFLLLFEHAKHTYLQAFVLAAPTTSFVIPPSYVTCLNSDVCSQVTNICKIAYSFHLCPFILHYFSSYYLLLSMSMFNMCNICLPATHQGLCFFVNCCIHYHLEQ